MTEYLQERGPDRIPTDKQRTCLKWNAECGEGEESGEVGESGGGGGVFLMDLSYLTITRINMLTHSL